VLQHLAADHGIEAAVGEGQVQTVGGEEGKQGRAVVVARELALPLPRRGQVIQGQVHADGIRAAERVCRNDVTALAAAQV
jgi:hypothetical protein